MKSWHLVILPSLKRSTFVPTQRAHVSGCRIFEYAERVCWILSDSAKDQVDKVARVNKLQSLLLMVGMLN